MGSFTIEELKRFKTMVRLLEENGLVLLESSLILGVINSHLSLLGEEQSTLTAPDGSPLMLTPKPDESDEEDETRC